MSFLLVPVQTELFCILVHVPGPFNILKPLYFVGH